MNALAYVKKELKKQRTELENQSEKIKKVEEEIDDDDLLYFVRIHGNVFSVGNNLKETIENAENKYIEKYKVESIHTRRYKVGVFVLYKYVSLYLPQQEDSCPLVLFMNEDINQDTAKKLGISEKDLKRILMGYFIKLEENVWGRFSKHATISEK